MFNATSGLVRTWVMLIQLGIYAIDQVPALDNLRAAVQTALNGD